VPIAAGRRLVTLRGTLESLAVEIARSGDVYLRIDVTEAPRPGLADAIRALDPERVVEVRVVGNAATIASATDPDAIDHLRRSPREIFAEYLEVTGKTDPRLLAMFDQLLDEVNAPDTP
jgi:exonuclease SbcD